jgi:hypothetical protein
MVAPVGDREQAIRAFTQRGEQASNDDLRAQRARIDQIRRRNAAPPFEAPPAQPLAPAPPEALQRPEPPPPPPERPGDVGRNIDLIA